MMMWVLTFVGVSLFRGAAASAGVCAPLPTRQWFVGCTHKTGTALLAGILRDVATENPGLLITPSDDSWWLDTAALENATAGVSLWIHAGLANASEVEGLVTWSWETKAKEARIVMFVRDPLEIALSGYFYHLHTLEDWTRTPIAWIEDHSAFDSPEFDAFAFRSLRSFKPLIDFSCPGAPAAFGGDIAVQAGCVFKARVAANASLSYQDLLTSVDPVIGVVIEALRVTGVVMPSLNRTVTLMQARPDVIRLFDLDTVAADAASFRDAFADAFTFLGAGDVDACVDLARHHDLNSYPPTKGRHAMSAEFTALRNALREILRSTAWFATVLDPIRRDMGYTE